MLEVDVDVRRLAPLLRDEALEEERRLGRVDRGDAQREADRRVGRRATPLAEDAATPREANDVVDREEVGGEVELFDDAELVLDISTHARGHTLGVAPGEALTHELSEPAHRRPAFGHHLRGVAVAELAQGEGAALGDHLGAGDGIGQVGEACTELARTQEVAGAVGGQRTTGGGEGDAAADAGEHVGHFAALGHVVHHVVGREHRPIERAC